jgi:hypothetical protein
MRPRIKLCCMAESPGYYVGSSHSALKIPSDRQNYVVGRAFVPEFLNDKVTMLHSTDLLIRCARADMRWKLWTRLVSQGRL